MSAREPSQWDPGAVTRDVQAIVRDSNYELLVARAAVWGPQLARGQQQEASKAQVRRIFGEIKQIEMRWNHDQKASVERLRMLKPRLAYAAARPNVGPGVARLRDILTPAVDAVLEIQAEKVRLERFRTFVRLTEALLAYFTAAKGGEEGGPRTAPARQGGRP